jgi:endonuclease/exonuclease/phosphatase family metal-dependent hydrolase
MHCPIVGAVATALLLAATSSARADPLEPAWSETLQIAQYNVQFVTPWSWGSVSRKHWPNTEARARAIGRSLACFDIVALNETINDRRRAEIFDEMERVGRACGGASRLANGRSFAVIAGPKPERLTFDQVARFLIKGTALGLLDDEVALASRLPVIATDSITYSVARGSDALAAKGAVHARVWRGGDAPSTDAIDLFITHLQANHADVRETQLDELVAFIKQRSDPALPAILLGDLNIDGSVDARRDPQAEYHAMMRQLAALGFRDPGLALGGTDSWLRRRIDYILVRSGQLHVAEMRTEQFNDLTVRALSDHAALTAEVIWRNAPPMLPAVEAKSSLIPLKWNDELQTHSFADIPVKIEKHSWNFRTVPTVISGAGRS